LSPITPQNILRHELIGLTVRVSDAKNPAIKGIQGAIIDETKNTLRILSPRGTLTIPKDIATFRFNLPNGVRVEVDGGRLTARPEGRLKTRVKRW